MATKRDLVEAHAFSRRRLATALLSGAPRGREVEPARPGRAIIGGAALALLVIAAGAVLGVLVGRTQDGWDDHPGIVIVRQPVGQYAVLRGTADRGRLDFRPLANSVSGRLIFGDVTPAVISERTIDGFTPGPAIGIADAPDQVPTPDDLIQTGWTACVDDALHLSVEVAETPEVSPLSGAGFVVADESDRHDYLIAQSSSDAPDPQAHSYLLPTGPAADTILSGLGISTAVRGAVPVPDSWLRLFPPGGPLTRAGFDRRWFGRTVLGHGTNHIPENARYGDYLRLGDDLYVFASKGPARLDPFAAAVYLGTLPSGVNAPRRLDGDIAPGGRDDAFFDLNGWPTTALATFAGRDYCARLDTTAGEDSQVQMAQDPTGVAAPDPDQPPLVPQRFVEPGHGAFVYTGDLGSTSADPIVIDPRGDAYPVEEAISIHNLGYDKDPAPVVPDTWAKLFDRPGGTVILSRSRALCAPDAAPNDVCATE